MKVTSYKLKPHKVTLSPKAQIGLIAIGAYLSYKLSQSIFSLYQRFDLPMILSSGATTNGQAKGKKQKAENIVNS